MAHAGPLLAFLLAAQPAAVSTGTGPRVALVPFELVQRAGRAREVVMRASEEALAKKGYVVVGGDAVEQFLRSHRIRYLDSLTSAQAAELLRAVDATAVVLGTVLAWDRGDRESSVALSIRVLGPSGQLVWADLGALTTAQSEGPFGRGKLTEPEMLAPRLVERLLAPLPAGGLVGLSLPRPERAGGPRVFRAPEAAVRPLRMAVLPLQNFSDDRDAPRVIDAVLQQRLAARPGLTPVDAAELRAALVRTRLRPPSQLAPEQLRSLGQAIGTPLFLRGSIFEYGPSAEDGAGTPAIEIYLALVDVESGRTLWSGLHRRTGLEYQGLLKFGAERSAVALATRVVGELLTEFTRP
jgi:hypothetical protein